ncbi:MAG: hypothetical protein JW944_05450 [Deltaproteobacteria bacterium]|nr:hypothetical protein [Deltaproteobacteria bacterium]
MTESNMTISIKPRRRPGWTRVLDVFLRAAHVGVTGILLGGAVFQVPFDVFLKCQLFAIATGCALIASEVYHKPHWLYQGRAVMVFIHSGLLFLIRFKPAIMVPLLSMSVLIGMAGSHMSKKFRYWSIIHWRAED